ncbi:putative tetratricopeptide-like helical domain superfamily, pentacotripeptide-repeat region of PRORP [Dioscorea sansibarensis]
MGFNVIELCSPNICCFNHTCFENNVKVVSLCDLAALRRRNVGNSVVFYVDFVSYRRTCRKIHLGSCRVGGRYVNGRGSDELWRNGLSSENVVEVLESMPDPEQALDFFETIAKQSKIIHTTESFNYMLEFLRKHGRVGDMVHVFDLMQKQIVKRSPATFLTIFKSLGVQGGLRSASFALSRMSKAGFVLNAFSYNGLIHFLLQSGLAREALEVYKRMVSEGITPSLKTYSALMVALGKKRNVETVMSLLSEMEGLGLKPNVYTFTICIRALGQTGKIDEAYGLLHRMEEEGCQPDVVTYTVLIEVLCEAGRLEKARELFVRMKSSDQRPDRVTYITLVGQVW